MAWPSRAWQQWASWPDRRKGPRTPRTRQRRDVHGTWALSGRKVSESVTRAPTLGNRLPLLQKPRTESLKPRAYSLVSEHLLGALHATHQRFDVGRLAVDVN